MLPLSVSSRPCPLRACLSRLWCWTEISHSNRIDIMIVGHLMSVQGEKGNGQPRDVGSRFMDPSSSPRPGMLDNRGEGNVELAHGARDKAQSADHSEHITKHPKQIAQTPKTKRAPHHFISPPALLTGADLRAITCPSCALRSKKSQHLHP